MNNLQKMNENELKNINGGFAWAPFIAGAAAGIAGNIVGLAGIYYMTKNNFK